MTRKNINPFLHYSAQLQSQLQKAAKQSNPALWLHQNGGRTTIFMLEALTRLHDEAFDEKLFGKWCKRFKKLEDQLGQIDHYLTLTKEFKANKKINNELISRFSKGAEKAIAKCNKTLSEKGWHEDKLSDFDKKLNEYTVIYNKVYIKELEVAIKAEIEDLIIFLEKCNYSFTKIEKQVHDFRRRLRWLSIYGQALNGIIQLKKSSKKTKYQINYLTKEILNSPYNKLPAKPKDVAVLEFDHTSFYALSWFICELGKLKDQGIRVEELSEAIYLYEDITEHQSKEKAAKLLGEKSSVTLDVLNKASDLAKTFVLKDKILDTLLVK